MEKPVKITRLPKSEYFASVFEIFNRQKRLPQQIPLTKLSKRVDERTVTDTSVAIPECVSCGACCFFGMIPIERREPEHLAEYIEVLADHSDVVIERVLYRDEADGRCRHLSGELAVNVGCEVYPDRPRACRDFEAGSDRCFGYRRMFGVDPPLGDAELEAVLEKFSVRPQPVK
ncbi:MAG: YkgJ family cysteine cluster protein, partial [Acidobacteria bacterium]|nr:YkgJ family cysteine cluster protein [Acidobacteriota bacterium]